MTAAAYDTAVPPKPRRSRQFKVGLASAAVVVLAAVGVTIAVVSSSPGGPTALPCGTSAWQVVSDNNTGRGGTTETFTDTTVTFQTDGTVALTYGPDGGANWTQQGQSGAYPRPGMIETYRYSIHGHSIYFTFVSVANKTDNSDYLFDMPADDPFQLTCSSNRMDLLHTSDFGRDITFAPTG